MRKEETDSNRSLDNIHFAIRKGIILKGVSAGSKRQNMLDGAEVLKRC